MEWTKRNNCASPSKSGWTNSKSVGVCENASFTFPSHFTCLFDCVNTFLCAVKVTVITCADSVLEFGCVSCWVSFSINAPPTTLRLCWPQLSPENEQLFPTLTLRLLWRGDSILLFTEVREWCLREEKHRFYTRRVHCAHGRTHSKTGVHLQLSSEPPDTVGMSTVCVIFPSLMQQRRVNDSQ